MVQLKVLITSDGYRDDINGVAQIVAVYADEMRRRGIEVKVLTLSDQNISYKNGDDYYLQSYRSIFYPEWKKSHIRRHAFIDEIVAWKPDIIHIHTEGPTGIIANMISDICGVPIVMTSHTDYSKYLFGKVCKIFPITLIPIVWGLFAYKHASLVILPAEKALTFDQHVFVKNKCTVLHNGINLKKFQRNVTKEERRKLMSQYGIRDNNKILLVVSRLGKEKKITNILNWMKQLLEKDPEIQLVIVGDGLYRKKLEKQTAKLNINDSVFFTGRIPPDQIYRFYNIGTVYVSASDFEVNSLSYIEAMACSLPIVCRKDMCLKGVLENGVNGYSFETGDDFCEYIMKILENEDIRRKLGQNAKEMSLRFDDKHFVDSTLEIYDEVITNMEGVCAH